MLKVVFELLTILRTVVVEPVKPPLPTTTTTTTSTVCTLYVQCSGHFPDVPKSLFYYVLLCAIVVIEIVQN